MAETSVLRAGPSLAGQAIATRPADPDRDAIDGVLPGVIVEPASPPEVAGTLAWAANHRLSVVIRGGGSKMPWGATPSAIDVVLDTSRLNRVLSHEAGDLTVTVEAGARLRDVNEVLARSGQWLALDPPFSDRSTIGGLLATNDSGPHRHRFGTPRDLVIGIALATVDGRLAKAGGRVVKNVAGYDLSKIASGSFGSVAAIVAATFKLSPVPAASSTIVVDGLDAATAARLVETISGSQLEPVAFELAASLRAERGIGCLLRFASFATVVEAEVANAGARIAALTSRFTVASGESEQQVWALHSQRVWQGSAMLVRASWMPGETSRMLSTLESLQGGATIDATGRAAVGAGLFRIAGPQDRQLEVVRRMRASEAFGNVVVVRAPAALKTREWVWGPGAVSGPALALKRELDPGGTLGAGRGPV